MKREGFSTPRAAVLLALVVVPVSLYASAREAHGGSGGISTLPVAAQHTVSAALGKDDPQYYVRGNSANFATSNARRTLAFRFSSQGVNLSSGSARWGIAFAGYGYGESLVPVSATPAQARLNRVEYLRGPVTEWYLNGPIGLEQGFTIARPPGQALGRPVTLALSLSGNLKASVDADGKGLTLIDGEGTRLRYGKLSASDVRGGNLRTWMEIRDRRLFLRVDDRSAEYPVTVDPFIELAELTASDGGPSDFFGLAVSISGKTVLVGSIAQIGSNSRQGAAYLFEEPVSGWTTTSTFTAKLTASDGKPGDWFGSGVAIKGNTAVVGACSQSDVCNNGPGKVYVFLKPSTGWATTSRFAAKLKASDGLATDGFGVSIGYGGNTIVVGAPQSTGTTHTGRGKAYVFVRPASGWKSMTQTAKLTASDGHAGDAFGFVSTSNDGSTVFVGAPLATVGSHLRQGAAYVFVKPTTGWATTSHFQAKLTAAGGAANDELGFCQNAVCISGDGSTVLAGAPQFNPLTNQFTGTGKAYVFARPASGWASTSTVTAKLTASDGTFGDMFGWSVAVNSTGSRAVIGAVSATVGVNHGQGAVYMFAKPSSGWKTSSHFNAKLIASDGGHGQNLGYSVGISGSTILAGAEAANSPAAGQGAAYVFAP